jgi:hypothetical protein
MRGVDGRHPGRVDRISAGNVARAAGKRSLWMRRDAASPGCGSIPRVPVELAASRGRDGVHDRGGLRRRHQPHPMPLRASSAANCV